MSQLEDDIQWMRRAFKIAEQGIGYVSPNPLVGCVIVRNGVMLGEGAYREFGGPHAEVLAVQHAEALGHSIQDATVYVTLEPHAHFGKTPPCTDLLIRKKIGRCVIATSDPNPQVAGRGIAMLRDASVEVDVGLLEAEAIEQNRFFFKHIVSGTPYVTVKLAQSIDGRSALANGLSQWITSEESRREVHRMRSQFDAVMIGSATARADDPALTVRLIEGRQPWRVVLDTELQLPSSLRLFTDEFANHTVLISSKGDQEANSKKRQEFEAQRVALIGVERSGRYVSLAAALSVLGARGITSVLVEPGPELAASFIGGGLFDEIVCFVAPRVIGGDAKASVGKLGIEAFASLLPLRLHSVRQVENSEDVQLVYRAH